MKRNPGWGVWGERPASELRGPLLGEVSDASLSRGLAPSVDGANGGHNRNPCRAVATNHIVERCAAAHDRIARTREVDAVPNARVARGNLVRRRARGAWGQKLARPCALGTEALAPIWIPRAGRIVAHPPTDASGCDGARAIRLDGRRGRTVGRKNRIRVCRRRVRGAARIGQVARIYDGIGSDVCRLRAHLE